MIRAVFIDRDGTINEERNYIHKIEEFQLIPGTIEALKLLTQNGIKIYIITNQSGIARGYFSEEQFLALTRHMLEIFKGEGIEIEEVLYCPHHPEGTVAEYAKDCLCRKPNTGLIEDVLRRDNFKPEEIAVIGDKDIDVEAGRRLGAVTYLVLTGYGREHQVESKPTYLMTDLLRAVEQILNGNIECV